MYTVRVVGPHAVPAGDPVVTRPQIFAFVGAMALLWTAVEVAPTPMLVAVEQSAQAPLKYGQTVHGVATWRIWFGQQRVLPVRHARQRPRAKA